MLPSLLCKRRWCLFVLCVLCLSLLLFGSYSYELGGKCSWRATKWHAAAVLCSSVELPLIRAKTRHLTPCSEWKSFENVFRYNFLYTVHFAITDF